MKRTIINILLSIFLLAFYCNTAHAQALLSPNDNGSTPDPSASLEIRSDNAGLLIPNVTLTYVEGDIAAPSIPGTPADGLIIFHSVDNGISKGLWYYDAVLLEWILYSDFTSELSERDIDDFGELYESNALGEGTSYPLESNFHNPWASATEGLSGSAFTFLDNEPVVTEIGPGIADQFEITGNDAIYSIVISGTLAASAPATTVTGVLYLNDNAVPHLFFRHTFQNKDKPTSLNTSGNLEIHTGDKIDFRFISSANNKGIEVENMNIRLSKLGDL